MTPGHNPLETFSVTFPREVVEHHVCVLAFDECGDVTKLGVGMAYNALS